MKRFIISGLLILATLTSSKAQKKDEVLVTIGKEPVTLSEFRQIFERNNSNIQDPENKKTPEEYLELFINFKLKVLEAESRGLDTTMAFRTELAGYRKDLAAPYLTDIRFDEEEVKATYDRTTKEVEASHLMLTLPENASPQDTLATMKKINDIRTEILNGLDFGEAAMRYSQDPSAKMNRGDLGWFSAFQMVYPFESAAYTTPPGQISHPVRTQFGYHLIKVKGFRDADGEVHVAHIMKTYPPAAGPEQKARAIHLADSIYALLQNGADFSQLAKELSDDAQSAANGGEMPWFSRGRMIPAFSDPAFALSKNGEISKPVDSGFGIHIIKRLDRKPVPTFEESKRELVEKIKRDPERSIHSRIAFISKLKSDYNYQANPSLVEDVLKKSAAWLKKDTSDSVFSAANNETLFTLDNKPYPISNWADYLKKQVVTQSILEPEKLADLFNTWVNSTVLEYEDGKLESKYPEFRSLMEEYHDGMLLFAISEEMIWQKASADSAGLAIFYETNKQKYQWPERFRGQIVRCANPQLKEEVEKLIDSGIPVDEVADILHLGEGNIFTEEGAWAPNEHPVIDHYIWNGPKPEDWNDEAGFVNGSKIAPEHKLLNEARGYHIADYQQYLEGEWLKQLRKKYTVKINNKVLKHMEND